MKTLSEIQRELKAPKGQVNAFGKYKYRSCEDILEAVKPHLEGWVLTISDEIVEVAGRVYVKATASLKGSDMIIYPESDNKKQLGMLSALEFQKESISSAEIKSGPMYVVSAYAREPDQKKGMDPSQITGAASSYARKYALNGLFCIDDTKDADTMDNSKQYTSKDQGPSRYVKLIEDEVLRLTEGEEDKNQIYLDIEEKIGFPLKERVNKSNSILQAAYRLLKDM